MRRPDKSSVISVQWSDSKMDSQIDPPGDHYIEFTKIHALFLVCSIITYIGDIILGDSYLYFRYVFFVPYPVFCCCERHIFVEFTWLVSYLFPIADFILAITYIQSGYYWYCLITVCLTVFPTLAVQVFSVRWHQLDGLMTKSFWVIHAFLLGVIQR